MDVHLATPRETLKKILGAVAPDPFVESIAIGGSFARGESDEVSDLDLWIEGKWWQPESLGSLFLAGAVGKLGGNPYLSGVMKGGTLVDVIYGPPCKGDYVDLELPEPAPLPITDLPKIGLVEEFWINQIKHRKNIWRGQPGLLIYGLNFDRQHLLRGWATREGKGDPGPGAFGIFTLKDLYPKYVTKERQALLGLPVRTTEELLYAMQAYRDEMSRLFPNPTELETTTRAMPLTPKGQQ